MIVEQDVLEVLSCAVTDGYALKLVGQLDRKLYEKTNKVLVLAGGKWNRYAQVHMFQDEAADAIEQIILTGEIIGKKQELQQFYSPKPVVDCLLEKADIETGMTVLEPNAGRGAILLEAAKHGALVSGYEIDPATIAYLSQFPEAQSVLQADFLTIDPTPTFDRVVMNPPFTRRADIKHVMHAYRFLRPGGRLAAVMSSSTLYRADQLTTEFNTFLTDHNGQYEVLPENAFKVSGTSVNTIIVVVGD